MARADILKPLPRRPWLTGVDLGPAELKIRDTAFPEASRWTLVWRGLQWMYSLLVYLFARLEDRFAGNKSTRQKGRRLRELFERVGGTGVKIGQQLAMRVDFFPYAICRELDKLLDTVPPFTLDEAIELIETGLERPISEIFADIDPEPIGAASIACVWAATLHSGERVAVKVQRPDVERLFVADIELVSRFTRLIELLSLVRPNFLENLRRELKDMFLSELDFIQEANYQNMFRRLAKQDKLDWVTAPKVYSEYSTDRILTTRFVDGVQALELLNALETRDEERMRALHADGIDPHQVGTRLLKLSYWMRLECFFFHSDPHPGNIFILPGNELVMIDFGSCGVNPSDMSSGEYELVRRFVEGDIAGATNASLVVQAPFPNIDLVHYSRIVQRVFWKRYIDMESKDAQWWERTTASLWIAALEVTRKFQIPVNVNMLRLIRATLLYDTLAFRLNPNINFPQAFRTWSKDARKRGRRRLRRFDVRFTKHAGAHVVKQLGDVTENLERGVFWANRLMHNLPRQFTAVAGQGAYFVSTMIRLMLTGVLAFVLTGAGVFTYLALFGRVGVEEFIGVFTRTVQWAATSPVVIIVGILVLLQIMGHIQKKLGETDE